MAEQRPWMKFYPQDWRADEKLRMCSLGARGLWIEMLALMHRSERYGTLLVADVVPSIEQLAMQVGASSETVADLLKELEAAGVFSRTAGNAIYSRRMKRDEKRAKNARQNGKNGGNPRLRPINGKQTDNPPSDKGEVNEQDKGGDKAQIPETRDQRPDKENIQSTSSHARETEDWSVGRLVDVAVLAEEAGRLAGLGEIGRSSTLTVSQVQSWLSDGIAEETILRTVQRVMGTSTEPTNSMKRFDKAIRHEHARGLASGHPDSPPRALSAEQQIAHFQTMAERMAAIGRTDDAAEFRQKADRLLVQQPRALATGEGG